MGNDKLGELKENSCVFIVVVVLWMFIEISCCTHAPACVSIICCFILVAAAMLRHFCEDVLVECIDLNT